MKRAKDRRLALAFTSMLLASAAHAQTGPREFQNPPTLQAVAPAQAKVKTNLLSGQVGPGGAPGDTVLDLNIVYTDSQIWNPLTGQNDKVHLRSYTGTGIDPNAPFVAPSIEIRPGQTIRINLNNKLPADPTCAANDPTPDVPHCFNGTNLHSHGLWVNPAGNGDNVLLSIDPGVSFQYEYNVPADHPSGTFWYHTHRHGSTALQVSSGMAGALVVRGDRLPGLATNGDLDTLLAGMPEKLLVFQQIQYACYANGQLRLNPDKTYNCAPDPAIGPSASTGVIENYDVFAPGQWPQSGRHTSVNGLVMPTFRATQGQIERWRMIHGGVRDTIALQFMKLKPGVIPPKVMSLAQEQAFIRANCAPAGLPMQLVAADGLTMARAQQSDIAVFQPGYRFDALVVFPETGVYCVVDQTTSGAGSIGGAGSPPRLIGYVAVAPGTPVGPDVRAYVGGKLIEAAKAKMPAPVAPRVVADLQAGLGLASFTPHPDIADSEVTGTQELTFYLGQVNPADPNNPFIFAVSNTDSGADARPYDPNRIDRQLMLGGVDEWTLQSNSISHPFHIHVNPFQIVSITDPNGRDVSLPGAVDNAGDSNCGKPGGPRCDPEYPGLKGVWKDTLWVKTLQFQNQPAGQFYKIKVRTRYQRYIGQFVLHCHILDHEDQGMMQNVAIVLPGNVAASTNQAGGHQH